MAKLPIKKRRAVFAEALSLAFEVKNRQGIEALTIAELSRCVRKAQDSVGVTLTDAEETAQVAALIAS